MERRRRGPAKLAVPVALAIGCVTTTYHDFKPSDVKAEDGVAIGRVRVRFNDLFYTKECSVCFGTVSEARYAQRLDPAPASYQPGEHEVSRCAKLEGDGIVFLPIPAGPAHLTTLRCGEARHELSRAYFRVPRGVVYFGDLVVEWKEQRTSLARGIMVGTMGLAGLALSQAIQRPATLVPLDDDDNPYGVLKAYREQVHDPKAMVTRSPVEIDEE